MGNKRKIFFRADAGAQIGYGHFIRSLALVDMLRGDFDCTFFTQSPSDYQRKEVAKLCNLVALPSDESKFDKFLQYLSGNEIVVLDNYFYDYNYQQKIKQKGCKLVCIDDVHQYAFCSDIIICPDPCPPSDFITDKHTKLFCGIEWSLLRRPIIENANKNNPINSDIVVAFGGADPYCITQKFVSQLLKETSCRICVIIGDKTQFSYNDERVIIYKNLSANEIASLFASVSVAILSASTICTEALCIGCPIIAGYYVDNQIEYYNYLSSNNLIIPIGNLLEYNDFSNMHIAIESAKSKSNKMEIDFLDKRKKIKDLFFSL